MQPDKETQIREFWKQKAESLDEAAQVQSLKRQLVDLEQANTDKINRLKKHIADLEKAREEQHAIAASLREECRATGEQNRSLLKDMGELESSLNAIKNSSSWRLTAPLRKLNRLKF